MRLALAITLVSLAACGGDDVPTAAELHGSWTNDEAGQTREFEFAASVDGDVYELSSYPTGTTPVVVQTGEYEITEATLVTFVVTGEGAGQTYGNAIVGWTGDSLTIETSAGAERTYTLTD